MAKRRKSRASNAPFSYVFTSKFQPWRNGDTTKADPFFILILNNIALEQPFGSNRFGADMSRTADKDLFVETAEYINKNLFGEMTGQAEKLLASSPHRKKIKLWSMFLSGLPVDGTTSLVAEHQVEMSSAIKPRRQAVVSMLARLGINPDIVFLVSKSSNRRAWAIPTTDDDARGGIAVTYDGKRIYHRFYHEIPGMVAINVASNNTMTAAHEFGHAFSSYSNGHVVDLYSDDFRPDRVLRSARKVRWPIPGNFPFNWKKKDRPIPKKFATYNGKTYLSDKTRNSLGYEPEWTSYHSELVNAREPALMDKYHFPEASDPMACLHDKMTKAYIMDRIAAKVSR